MRSTQQMHMILVAPKTLNLNSVSLGYSLSYLLQTLYNLSPQ